MEYAHVPKTDLARKTSQIIRNVLRGQPAIIENHGQPEAIVVDLVDYLILRAAAHYLAGNLPPLKPNGPQNDDFIGLGSQERYNLAMEYYLSEACSTRRMAELLLISWLEMRERFNRLGIPLFLGPRDLEEAREEARAAALYDLTPNQE